MELVEAAFVLVAQAGFEGLRLRRVAQDVGIDQSTLHHYFATKDDLVRAVTEYTTTRLAGSAPPGDTPPEEALATHLRALGELMRTEPDLFTVSAELDLRARRDPVVRRALAAQETGWRAALVAMCPARGVPPEEVAELVIATVKGVRLAPDLAPLVLDRLVALLTGGKSS